MVPNHQPVKIGGKWMFIPVKMVFIGIDPWPNCEKAGITCFFRCAEWTIRWSCNFYVFFFCPLFFWIHMMDYNKSPIYFGLYNTQSSTDRDIEHSSRIIKHFIRVGCIFCDIAKGPTVSCLWIWTIAITVVSICHVFMFFPQWLSYLVANYPRLVSGL